MLRHGQSWNTAAQHVTGLSSSTLDVPPLPCTIRLQHLTVTPRHADKPVELGIQAAGVPYAREGDQRNEMQHFLYADVVVEQQVAAYRHRSSSSTCCQCRGVQSLLAGMHWRSNACAATCVFRLDLTITWRKRSPGQSIYWISLLSFVLCLYGVNTVV